MSNSRLELPTLLAEAKIKDMVREAEHWRLVDEMRANGMAERESRLALLAARARDLLARLAFFWRRAESTARQRAAQPKTRSQTMQIPSGSA